MSSSFINTIQAINETLKNFSTEMELQPVEILTKKPSEKAWSVIECFSHMNKATELYLDQIEPKLLTLKSLSQGSEYQPSLSVKLFSKMMTPTKEGKIKAKMKTFKTFAPF